MHDRPDTSAQGRDGNVNRTYVVLGESEAEDFLRQTALARKHVLNATGTAQLNNVLFIVLFVARPGKHLPMGTNGGHCSPLDAATTLSELVSNHPANISPLTLRLVGGSHSKSNLFAFLRDNAEPERLALSAVAASLTSPATRREQRVLVGGPYTQVALLAFCADVLPLALVC